MNRRIWPVVLVPFASWSCAVVDAASSLAEMAESLTAEEAKPPPPPESTELPPELRAKLVAMPPFVWDLEALGKACGYGNTCSGEAERQKALCKTQKLTGIPQHPYGPPEAQEICGNELASQEKQLAPLIEKYEAKKKADEAIADRAKAEAVKAEEEATTVLPRAVKRDTSVERVIAAGYTSDGQKVIKVLLTDDWEMVRAQTGVVTGRAITAHIVSRVKDGCQVASAHWLQEHDGSRFSGPVRLLRNLDSKWISCAKAR